MPTSRFRRCASDNTTPVVKLILHLGLGIGRKEVQTAAAHIPLIAWQPEVQGLDQDRTRPRAECTLASSASLLDLWPYGNPQDERTIALLRYTPGFDAVSDKRHGSLPGTYIGGLKFCLWPVPESTTSS